MTESPLIDARPSEGAKRRSRGITVVLAEWLSIGTAAIPRLAALARNDITQDRIRKQEERERVLAAVERERARLADLFRQVPAAIAVLHGRDHVYEVVNDLYRAMIGDRPLVGLPIREALPELAGQGSYELLDQVRHTGQAFVGNERLVRVDADVNGVPEDHYYNFVYQPIRDETDTATRIFVHAVEVTGIAEAKQSADQARRVAEDANRAKSQFLAAMSHELRTPLNAIAGHAQLLELGIHGALTADQSEAIARIQRSQQHLLALINDVLNFAKLEAGKVEYRSVQSVDREGSTFSFVL